jgi:aconitate hydratase
MNARDVREHSPANEMVRARKAAGRRRTPGGSPESIYDASMAYQQAGTPLVVIAGKEYGTGSSRDWAAKGTCFSAFVP